MHMHWDLAKLRELFDVINELDIAEFEHEAEGHRVRIVRRPAAPAGYAPMHGAPMAVSHSAPAAPASDARLPDDVIDVTSPFVGTFYRAPSPDTPAFADVGTVVRPGQPLCIIEAMKLMNEIEAEFAGTVVEIFAQNGKSVEFGQKLFRIKKA
jgi:acetyl-CoA carboxylase biotin carboxyl carrier protein